MKEIKYVTLPYMGQFSYQLCNTMSIILKKTIPDVNFRFIFVNRKIGTLLVPFLKLKILYQLFYARESFINISVLTACQVILVPLAGTLNFVSLSIKGSRIEPT